MLECLDVKPEGLFERLAAIAFLYLNEELDLIEWMVWMAFACSVSSMLSRTNNIAWFNHLRIVVAHHWLWNLLADPFSLNCLSSLCSRNCDNFTVSSGG